MSDIGFGPVGDPPIIYDTSTADGYGRVTRLVDRRLLEHGEAVAEWLIAEQEHEYEAALDGLESERDDPYSQTNQNAAAWRVVASHPLIGAIEKLPERGTYAEMVRARLDALAAERDHWRAEAEKARTPDASNPAHWRFAADLIPGHWRLRSGDTAVAGIFRREADRLESEATADDVVEKAEDVPADQPWLVKYRNREWWGFRRRIHHRQSEWYLLGVTHDGVKFASDRDVELVSPLGPLAAGLLRGES